VTFLVEETKGVLTEPTTGTETDASPSEAPPPTDAAPV
jgi:hypothetical protein